MKKIICFTIVFIMILSVANFSALAAGEINIISPVATAYADLANIEVECTQAAEKIIFELDGKKIGETDGETRLPVPENSLTVGNHTLAVSAIFEDKTAARDSLDFMVYHRIEAQSYIQNFNSYTQENKTLPTGIAHTSTSGRTQAEPVSGASGEAGDSALHIKFISDTDTGNGEYLKSTSFKNFGDGIASFKFDIKADVPASERIRLLYMPLWHNDLHFLRDGKIYKTSKSVSADWMRYELKVDYSKGTTSLYVDSEELYNGPSGNSGVYDNSIFELMVMQSGNRDGEGTRAGYSLDNLHFEQYYLYGIDVLSYSSDGGTSWTPYNGELPASATHLGITTREKLTSGDITTETVTLYENGAKKAISDVSYVEDTKMIVLTPQQPFNKGTEIVVKLADTIKLKSGKAAGRMLEARFFTQQPELAPTNLTFKKNGSLLINSAQLQEGDIVSVDVTLNSDTPKTMAAIVTVRQNGKLRSVGAVEETNLTGSKPVTVTLPAITALDDEGEVSVKLILCNGLATTVPYLSYTELK